MIKRLFLLLFFYPCLVMGQTNALYTLLNWNTAEQQKSLIAWYDLQDPSMVQLSANQGVYKLQDKSIWKNHISQPTSFYQPLFISDSRLNAITTVNGISFANGGFMLLKFPTTKTVQDITSFVICKNSLGGSKLLYDLGIDGGEGIASCYAGLDKIESRVPNSLVAYEPNFISNPNQYLFIATRGSAGNVQASLNYSQYNGQGTRNFVGDQYNRIRLSTEPGDAPSDGTLYELILFDRKLKDEEYAKVKNYLIGKYNLQTIVYQKNTTTVSESKTLLNSNVSPNQNAARSPKSSLIEGNTKSIKQKSLSDQVADAILQNAVNDFLKGFNNPNPSPASSKSSSSAPSKSSNSAASVSGSSTCIFCKPGNANGWYIKNFNASTRTYSNGRYVKRPGYKVCDICQGTGDCRISCSGGKRDCPGICDEKGTCTRCYGERFVLCNYCKGSGTN